MMSDYDVIVVGGDMPESKPLWHAPDRTPYPSHHSKVEQIGHMSCNPAIAD